MKRILTLVFIALIILKYEKADAQLWTDGRFSNTLDIGIQRNSNTHPIVGLTIHKNYNTSFQFAELGHSASHGILFSAYQNSTTSGGLGNTGNTKYYHGSGQYGGGAGAIMFYGNGGTMDFLISPTSTGKDSNIAWGVPKMRIKRNGNIGIGTTSPVANLDIVGPSTGNGYLINPTLKVSSGSTSGRVAMWLETQNDNATDFVFRNNGEGRVWMSSRGSNENYDFRIYTNPDGSGAPEKLALSISQGGNIGIGTTTPGAKLSVNGTIHSKEVKVNLNGWPDYVFAQNYKLNSLEETESYIKQEGHLPNIPSASEVEENGINLGEMNAKLLEKIEELTLHLIEMKKENVSMKKDIEKLKKQFHK